MKKLFFVLIVAVVALASCIKNYDDGPFISFRSTSKLLLKTWKVDQFLVDNIDSTKLYYDSCGCDLKFDNREGDDPKFYFTTNCINNSLECGGHFSFDRKMIKIISGGSNRIVIPFIADSKWEIKRLSKHDFWIISVINGKNYFLKLNEI